ncbi:PTS sugar transporter subunit IIA [Elusimicrobiota bacterium]
MVLGWFKKDEDKSPSPKQGSPSGPTASNVSTKRVSVSLLLRDDLIVVSPPKLDKDGLIRMLAEELCSKLSLGDSAPYLAKVLEREQGISTTLDTGLAVPHARMDGLDRIVAALGLVPEGMQDPKQPDLIIRAMFLFFSPNRQESFTQHLHLLRGVSSLMQPGFIDEMLRDPSGAAVLKLVRQKEYGV